MGASSTGPVFGSTTIDKAPPRAFSPFQDSMPKEFAAIQLKLPDYETSDLVILFKKIIDRENIEGKRNSENFLKVTSNSFEVELNNFKALLDDLEKKKTDKCKTEYVLTIIM